MKRYIFIAIVLFSSIAIAGQTMAQDKPVIRPLTTEKAEGKVTAYKPGKVIQVKGPRRSRWTFQIDPLTEIKGEVKREKKVTVLYRTEGKKMIAGTIFGIMKKQK